MFSTRLKVYLRSTRHETLRFSMTAASNQHMTAKCPNDRLQPEPTNSELDWLG